MEIRIFKTGAELNQSFTEWFKEIVAEKEKVTIALSGGSTPKSLFDYWAKLPAQEIDWTKIKFFWGDERCVPPTHAESNYKMTKEHLLILCRYHPKIYFASLVKTILLLKQNGMEKRLSAKWRP